MCIVTLSNSQAYVVTHSDKHIHPLQIFFFKDFHCKAQLFVHTTFHFYIQLFCSMCRVLTGHILVLYNFNLQIVSMECMMTTKSRISVLILAGIQWVSLPVACKVFLETWVHISQCSTVCKVPTRLIQKVSTVSL